MPTHLLGLWLTLQCTDFCCLWHASPLRCSGASRSNFTQLIGAATQATINTTGGSCVGARGGADTRFTFRVPAVGTTSASGPAPGPGSGQRVAAQQSGVVRIVGLRGNQALSGSLLHQVRRPLDDLQPGGQRYASICVGGLAAQLAAECGASRVAARAAIIESNAAQQDAALGVAHPGSARMPGWIGIDPAFLATSALYNAKVRSHVFRAAVLKAGFMQALSHGFPGACPRNKLLRLPRPLQVANAVGEWYNTSASARQVNPQGVPYGFAPRTPPGRLPRFGDA